MSRSLRQHIARRQAWRALRRRVTEACQADPKLFAMLRHIASLARPDWRLREVLWVAFWADMSAYAGWRRPISNCIWTKNVDCGCPVPRVKEARDEPVGP